MEGMARDLFGSDLLGFTRMSLGLVWIFDLVQTRIARICTDFEPQRHGAKAETHGRDARTTGHDCETMRRPDHVPARWLTMSPVIRRPVIIFNRCMVAAVT